MKSSDRLPVISQPYFILACIVMLVIHMVGLWGLNSLFYHDLFERTAGLNLLLSCLLVFLFHHSIDRQILIFCLISFCIGMTVEAIGVSSGYPFGIYHYTPSFGPQLAHVPIIIGINWILLSYVVGTTVAIRLVKPLYKVIAGAILMVFIDILLENFAIKHHFWVWQDSRPPFQNYLSWFFISTMLQIAFVRLIPAYPNRMAIFYVCLLILFLAADLFFPQTGRTF